MNRHPLLRFVFSSWGSSPSLTLGEERISAFVKYHCDEAEDVYRFAGDLDIVCPWVARMDESAKHGTGTSSAKK